MASPEKTTGGTPRRDRTDEQIRDTFDRLGLNNPALRQWMRDLAQLDNSDQLPLPQYWIGSDSGTSLEHRHG